jgi:hypothetical protein
MIELTEQQRQELRSEEPPRVYDPGTNETYVLVKASTYEHLRNLLKEDEDGLTMQKVALLVEEAMREDDEGDPTLAYYQQKYGIKR